MASKKTETNKKGSGKKFATKSETETRIMKEFMKKDVDDISSRGKDKTLNRTKTKVTTGVERKIKGRDYHSWP